MLFLTCFRRGTSVTYQGPHAPGFRARFTLTLPVFQISRSQRLLRLKRARKALFQHLPRSTIIPKVPRAGLEPARAEAQRILSPLRLPIPPSRRACEKYRKPEEDAIGGTTSVGPNGAPCCARGNQSTRSLQYRAFCSRSFASFPCPLSPPKKRSRRSARSLPRRRRRRMCRTRAGRRRRRCCSRMERGYRARRVESASFSLVIPALTGAFATAAAAGPAGRPGGGAEPGGHSGRPGVPRRRPRSARSLKPHRTSGLLRTRASFPCRTSDSIRSWTRRCLGRPKRGLTWPGRWPSGPSYPNQSFRWGACWRPRTGGWCPASTWSTRTGRVFCVRSGGALATSVAYGLTGFRRLFLSCLHDPKGTPCGACRQLLVELSPEATLWMDRGTAAPEGASPDLLMPRLFQRRRARSGARQPGVGAPLVAARLVSAFYEYNAFKIDGSCSYK